MSVTRYRSIEEMPPPWRDPDDPVNLRAVALMMAFYFRLHPESDRRSGTRHFKTVKELNSDRRDPCRTGVERG